MTNKPLYKGRMYLIPTDLGSDVLRHIWPEAHRETIAHIRHFIVENERSARRFLKKSGFQIDFKHVVFYLLGKHATDPETMAYLNAALEGQDIGLLSEAGVPCIADPGQKMVAIAHKKGIRVIPLTGPSSIILGLMASGFNGQHFIFHAYLPIEKTLRRNKIKSIEQAAYRFDQTQIFMETPFRNRQLLSDLIETCAAETLLCVACDLTLPTEFIRSLPIKEWKKNMPDLHKRPGIFLLYHP